MFVQNTLPHEESFSQHRRPTKPDKADFFGPSTSQSGWLFSS